jgi:hypothetical protein
VYSISSDAFPLFLEEKWADKKYYMEITHNMLRDMLTQKSVDQKTVTDFRYPMQSM